MYEGVNASDGIGIGVARVAVEPDLSFTPHAPEDAKAEEERYQAAVAKFIEQTNAQIERMTKTVGEEAAAIMGAHIEFAEDEGIRDMVNGSIESGMCAEQAVSEAYDMYYNMFSNMEDELFRERAADVADVKTGLLADLLGQELVDLSTLPENSIVVVRELTPSMTADIDKDNVAGIVTETGGRTSHSAIIARALEIPAVLSVADATSNIKNGDMVVVDGTNGKVIPTPSDHDLEHYRAKAKQYAEEKLALEAYRGKETVTADGEKKLLVANIGNPDDANVASEHDCEGVGLFRSEFLFMDAKELPSEDEQFAAYQKVALRMKDQPVIIRTLDVGGDKEIPYLHLVKEENPFMGFRAVRYCLNNPDQYKVQLTALLRASAFGDIKIMVPLVTNIDEIRQVKALVKECMAELDARGVSYNKDIEVGTMIETPAASLIADDLAAVRLLLHRHQRPHRLHHVRRPRQRQGWLPLRGLPAGRPALPQAHHRGGQQGWHHGRHVRRGRGRSAAHPGAALLRPGRVLRLRAVHPAHPSHHLRVEQGRRRRPHREGHAAQDRH